jgi:DNA-binding transcriptional regulator YdaS (Cro superfamily)
MHSVEEIFDHFKPKRALAAKLGVSPQSLTRWSKYGVPPRSAITIEVLSGGKFKAVNIPLYNAAGS